MKTEALKTPEWMAVLGLITTLGVILGIVFWDKDSNFDAKSTTPHAIVDPHVWITIEGGVEHPGKVKVLRGTPLKEALAQVGLLPDADTAKLKLECKVRKGQKVWVPSHNWVFLEIEGVGHVKVPKGSRFNQLPGLITLPEGVVRAQFKSKRLLKDREKIFLKTKEENS